MGAKNFSLFTPPTRPDPVRITPAKLAVLDFMQDYDVIPSSYVHAHFGHPKFTGAILTDFGKAHFIQLANGYEHFNARYRIYPLELTSLALKALKEAGRYRPCQRLNDHFKHRYLRSVIDHSFRQAPREHPQLTLRIEADILAYPNCPQATRAAPNPSWFTVSNHVVRPDAPIFGYQYRGGDQSAFMFLHGFEADRGTERQTAKNDFAKKSIAKMFEQYAQYLTEQGYRRLYGLSQITIPIITIGQQRMDTMLETLKATVKDPLIQKRFIFKCVPDFLRYDPLPPATGHMVTEDWQRVDGPFNILSTLKSVAERKQHG